ncbi:S-adenosyl-L-methionine-dependent methyltransferase [Immersiella caudata]|uniref:S-adenosyl-L-methionine-dependent methyltransferase n=1 Tax=Immersiella caudata TaxID=314043 RepID=A0AA39WRB1_9PEZI|nr:S-adenosyl-L-methionine-dependent methyltransferase [Immersiella caudata]
MTSAKGAKELNKFFQNLYSAIGTSWEDVLLDNAQRVSVPLVTQMLNQIGLNEDTSKPFKLLDNGCGAGVVASELQRRIKPEVLQQSSILCGDFSQQVIGFVQKRINEERWTNTEASTVDAQKTNLPSSSFSHVTMNIGFHVVPDSEAALDETIRILSPGGTLAFTTWTQPLGWAPDIQRAFASFPFEAPFAASTQTTSWGEWSDPNWIRKTLESKGLQDVKAEPYAFLQKVDSAEYFVRNFGMIVNLVMTSCWSEETRNAHSREEVEGLVKAFLEERYRGGSWDLLWVAIVASGRIPK